jgi:hypothetical protein
VSLAVEPMWAPLRGKPRFEALLARTGLLGSVETPKSLGVLNPPTAVA